MNAKVRDVMTPGPIGVDYYQSIGDAARTMRDWGVGAILVVHEQSLRGQPVSAAATAMKEHGIGAVLIMAGGRLSGLVTDRDIAVRVLAENRDPLTTRVGDICSTELAVLGPDDDVARAARLVRERAVRRIPVVQDGTPVGMVSIPDGIVPD